MKAATYPRAGRARHIDTHGESRDIWGGFTSLALLLVVANAVPAAVAFWVDRVGAFGTLEVPWWTPGLAAWAVAGFVTYTMMAVAGWLIVRQRDVTILGRWAMIPWETQLALGALAAVALFGFQLPGPALALLIVQAGALVVTGMRFCFLSRPATWLATISLLGVAAFLAWTGVAYVLNPEVGP